MIEVIHISTGPTRVVRDAKCVRDGIIAVLHRTSSSSRSRHFEGLDLKTWSE